MGVVVRTCFGDGVASLYGLGMIGAFEGDGMGEDDQRDRRQWTVRELWRRKWGLSPICVAWHLRY